MVARGFPDKRRGMPEEHLGGRAAPARIARREVAAEIAGADAAEQRVRKGVKADVGVGVTQETLIVRHRHAAQHHLVAFAEAVHVEAEAAATLGRTGQQPLAATEIVFRRHLEIFLVARHEPDPQARVFGDRRIVGQAKPDAAAVRL